jgi:hypothetical protein
MLARHKLAISILNFILILQFHDVKQVLLREYGVDCGHRLVDREAGEVIGLDPE